MEGLNKLLEFLIGKEHPLSAKASLVLLTLVSIWLVNNISGFTYYYNTRNKIEQVKALNALAANDSTSAEVKRRSRALQLEILTRTNGPEKAIAYASRVYTNIQTNLSASAKEDAPRQAPQIPRVAEIQIAPRNEAIFLLSSTAYWLMMGLWAVPMMIRAGFKDGWGTALAGFIIIEALVFLVGGTFYLLLGLIPPIKGSWGLSYALGGALQTILITATAAGVIKNKKK
jgi:hypothetical protein